MTDASCTFKHILARKLRFGQVEPRTACALASVVLGLSLVVPDVSYSGAGAEHADGLRWTASAAALARRSDNLVANPSAAARRHGSAVCYSTATFTGRSVRFGAAPAGASGPLVLRIGPHQHPAMVTQSPTCAPRVTVGHSYSASLQYRSSAGSASFEVLAHTTTGGWRTWYVARTLARRGSFTTVTVLLAPIQGGTDRIAFGLLPGSAGTVQSRNFSLIDATAHPQALAPVLPAAQPAGPAAALSGPSSPTGLPATPTLPPSEESSPAPTSGGLAATGRWTVLEDGEQARSVHAILLQNGKLLIMAGSGNDPMAFKAGSFKSFLYDPVANTWKELVTPKDVFCSGHVQLADGNVLILGGTSAYPPEPKPGEYPSTEYKGANTSWIFNIHDDEYEDVPYDEAEPHNPAEPGPLLGGEWYPSTTELGNGDVISFGGLGENGQGDTKTNYFIDPANGEDATGDKPGEWVGFGSDQLQQTYPWYWGEYPSMILTADGRLFYDGSHVFGDGLENTSQAPTGSALYDFYCGEPVKGSGYPGEDPNAPNADALVKGPNGTYARVTPTPGLRDPDERDQSASLLLPPAQEQRVMIMGGGNTYTTLKGSGQSAIDLTDEIDLKEADPHWVAGPDLPQGMTESGSMEPAGAGKMYISAVALPDGTVLETDGSEYVRTEDVHETSIFDPRTNAFTSVAPDPVGRDYHSEALLLPDGRVIALGSNPVDAATGASTFETRVSIYEPPYLFKGERPAIDLIDGRINETAADGTTTTTQWEYGSEHLLAYSSAAPIASAVLIRPGAVTHSSDPNQREVALPISANADGQLTVHLTANDNVAPPGYYMVFIVNSHGVPSVAQWVHVGPQGAPAS
jgi:Domain of unknown function (DUF1929)